MGFDFGFWDVLYFILFKKHDRDLKVKKVEGQGHSRCPTHHWKLRNLPTVNRQWRWFICIPACQRFEKSGFTLTGSYITCKQETRSRNKGIRDKSKASSNQWRIQNDKRHMTKEKREKRKSFYNQMWSTQITIRKQNVHKWQIKE